MAGMLTGLRVVIWGEALQILLGSEDAWALKMGGGAGTEDSYRCEMAGQGSSACIRPPKSK